MKYGIIYMATNKINGKKYIGQTINTLKQRVGEHKKDSSRYLHIKFYRAIRKYGFDSFIWETLYEDIPTNQLDNMEAWIIANYDTYCNGYNSTLGGHSHMHTEEVNRKISESNKGEKNHFYGKKHTDETKRKMSENHADFSNGNHPMYGKHLSEEAKIKLREAHLGKKHTEEAKKKMSEYRKGRKPTEEAKRHMSESSIGEHNGMFGKKHTKEVKENMSKSRSGPGNHRFGKKQSEETLRKIKESKERNKLLRQAKSKPTNPLTALGLCK